MPAPVEAGVLGRASLRAIVTLCISTLAAVYRPAPVSSEKFVLIVVSNSSRRRRATASPPPRGVGP